MRCISNHRIKKRKVRYKKKEEAIVKPKKRNRFFFLEERQKDESNLKELNHRKLSHGKYPIPLQLALSLLFLQSQRQSQRQSQSQSLSLNLNPNHTEVDLMGKKCDLCSGVAKMYCESDQASLCWDCDGKVHGANFLVAKHTRCLLCSSCQSLTPWKATGLRLSPTFSVCDSCVVLKNAAGGGSGGVSSERVLLENRGQEIINSFDSEEDRIREDDGDGAESYDDDEDDEDDDDDDEYSEEDEYEDDVDDEEAENQVVPWSAAAQPPPMMSSSSSDGGSLGLVTKRTRENSDLTYSDDEIGSSSAQESDYSRPLKRLSRDDDPAFKSTAVVNSIVRLADESSSSPSSSSLFFAISKARRDLSR